MEFSEGGPVLAQSQQQTPTWTTDRLKHRHNERLLIPTHHLQVCFNWVLMLLVWEMFVWSAQRLSPLNISFFFLCPISSKNVPLSINNYSHKSHGVLVYFHWRGSRDEEEQKEEGEGRPCVVSLHHRISLNRFSMLPHQTSLHHTSVWEARM